MVNVFISQPMNGLTEKAIMEQRKAAIDEIVKQHPDDATIINTIFEVKPDMTCKSEGLWYLSQSLAALSGADVAYFCEGWENYRGCVIEHECAEKYGIPIIDARVVSG